MNSNRSHTNGRGRSLTTGCLRCLVALLGASLWLSAAGEAAATTRLKDICRVKGQEQNSLHGVGLVVGLKGTGDGGNFLPTIRGLAAVLQLYGSPAAGGEIELKDARNIALVLVTATVPAAGTRQGDRLDCEVSSMGAAKSLAGGRLMLTSLMGPAVGSDRVYALASGLVQLDDSEHALVGRIHQGCQMEEDILNLFVKDNKITLVIDEHHADFEIAHEIALLINANFEIDTLGKWIAKALNQQNIEVQVPPRNGDDPVDFVAQVLRLEIPLDPEVTTGARVVINERSGTIVIDGNVTVGPTVLTQKNIVVTTGPGVAGDAWFSVPGTEPAAELKDLVAGLRAMKVSTADMIEIIKQLETSGNLHGRVIIE